MDNDERRRYIQDRVKECEQKLKKYILQYYLWVGGEAVGKQVLLKNYGTKYASISINTKASPVPDIATCDLRDFFDHSKFIMYFSSIKWIISNNWKTLGNNFGITKAKFEVCMEDLNAGRTDADHYDPEDMTCPDSWEISDQTMQDFIAAYRTMEAVFKKLNL